MATLNQRIESLLPYVAGPVSSLLTKIPNQRARSGVVSTLVGVTGASVLTGVAIGLLVAPEGGREMRAQLTKSVDGFREEVIASLRQIAARQEAKGAIHGNGTDARDEPGETPALIAEAAHEKGNGGRTRRGPKSARA
jgi:gas vesicle protein